MREQRVNNPTSNDGVGQEPFCRRELRCVLSLVAFFFLLLGSTEVSWGQGGGLFDGEIPFIAAPPPEAAPTEEEKMEEEKAEEEEPTIADLTERLRKAEDRLKELEEPSEENGGEVEEPPQPKKWYEKLSLSGYMQVRINETLSREPGSAPAHHVGDSSVGENENFLIRRARLVISGDISDHISVYFQPDFASSVPGSPDSNQYTQIRDWYADIHFDEAREYRVRLGQSKIPYGWENMQSSRNRLPLDRNDALNSAVKNERDLGAIFYWTPEPAQDFFDRVSDEGLKGSGNYGVFGLGVYNGQGGSLQEQNDNLHVVSRLTLPMTLENGQMMEVAVQGYTGKYVVLSSPISPLGRGPAIRPIGTLETGNDEGLRDDRIAGTFVYYPQPLGFQTEWTVGRGPSLNAAQTEVIERSLYGGYAMLMYRQQTDYWGEFWPFTRWTYYEGGYKSERNAPWSRIDEWELGLEWQLNENLEIVSMYTITDRTNTRAMSSRNDLSYRQFEGDLLRFQVQVRF